MWEIEELTESGQYSGEGIADGSTTVSLYDAVAMIADLGRDGDFRVLSEGEEAWSGTRAEANEWCDEMLAARGR
jgi:hypothetical protein